MNHTHAISLYQHGGFNINIYGINCVHFTLQAVCKDKIFPKVEFFAKGYGPSENPRRAYVLAYVIGIGFILIGKATTHPCL